MLRHLRPILLTLLTLSHFSSAEKPHIIYINVDDLGWADLSFNGSSYYETPNIDRIAKEGMAFTYGYAAAANCAPSRACALSGQNTQRHGVYTVKNSERGKAKDRKLVPTKNTEFLKDDNLTFAHALKSAGYTTATMGKWHISKDPLTNGFDINIAGTTAGGPYTGGYHSPFKYPHLEIKEKGTYLTDALTDKAIDFIKANKSSPFCLYLPYFNIHAPLQAKTELIEKYKNKTSSGPQKNPIYAAMLETLDTNIGRLLDTLETEGLSNKTLLIFTSDNGGVGAFSSQSPLRGGKGMYYEGGIRVPLFVRWPETIKAGSISETPVTNLDFFPTFCAVAGTPPPAGKHLDGISLLPLFAGNTIEPRALYWHFPIYLEAHGGANIMRHAQDPKFRTRPGSAIRFGDYKLIHYFENNDLELYHLKNDPSEQHNLADSHPEKAQALLQKLKNWRAKTNAPVPSVRNTHFRKSKR
jgi:arylsulfatase A-like enzyme